MTVTDVGGSNQGAGSFGVSTGQTAKRTNMRTILLTSIFLTPLALAQTPAPAPVAETPAKPEQVEAWIQRLGSDSYRERIKAEEELLRVGREARAALEAAAADERDGEIQWRAKRLLRQLGKGVAAPRREGLVERGRPGAEREQRPDIVERGRRSLPRRGGVDDMRTEFDRIFKRFEEMGLDVPSRRFFDQPFFKDLESQLRSGLDQDAAGQSMSVEIGPDGVRVEVVEVGEDGKAETKVYEAPDMETFQKAHPGLLKGRGFGLGLGDSRSPFDMLRGRIGKIERGFDWDIALPRAVPRQLQGPRAGARATPDAAPSQRGRRLGVRVKPIPEAVRAYLQLGEQGLMVESVEDGSLAASCRIQAEDIVTKVGARPIGSPADVAAALGDIAKGSEVRVELLRRGERKVVMATKQHDAEGERATGARERLRRKREERR